MTSSRWIPWWLASVAVASQAFAQAEIDPPKVDFNRQIRPILSESCYQCHGPDVNKRKADLRLDQRDGLFRSADGTTIVVPGKPEESELLARITADDPELRMPPPKSGAHLSPEQIDLIKRWIAEGAQWKGHWAYLPPTRPAVPVVARPAGSGQRNRPVHPRPARRRAARAAPPRPTGEP